MCLCYYEYGDGCTGDAITCVKCGHSYYPSSCELHILCLCRRIKNYSETNCNLLEGALYVMLTAVVILGAVLAVLAVLTMLIGLI